VKVRLCYDAVTLEALSPDHGPLPDDGVRPVDNVNQLPGGIVR
jgi:hypothetical protein